jgi:hypothetical protein
MPVSPEDNLSAARAVAHAFGMCVPFWILVWVVCCG